MYRSRFLLILSVATLMLPAVTTAVRAQDSSEGILSAIPQDAWAAVIVRDLKGLNGKIVAIGQDLGLPVGPGTMAGDPLTMLKGIVGATEGLNDSGSVALVLLKPEEATAQAVQEAVLLLVPATDPKVFLEQFATDAAAGPAKPEAAEKKTGDEPAEEEKKDQQPASQAEEKAGLPPGVVPIEIMGKSGFGAAKGKYALLAPTPNALKAYLAGKGSIRSSFDPDRLKMVEGKFDVFVWANIAAAGPVLKDPVKGALSAFMFMASMGDPAMATQAQQLIEAIEKFLDQAQSFQIGIAVTKAGIEIDGYVSAKPDTELAKTMADTPTTDKTLLVGLPAEPYMLALGVMSATTADQIKQSKAMVGSLLDKPQVKQATDAEKLAEFRKTLDEMMELAPAAKWWSMSISRLPEGSDGMVGLTVVSAAPGAAEKWQALMRRLFETGLQMVSDEDIQSVLKHVQFKPDAEKAGDAVMDHLTVDLAAIPDAEPEDIEGIKKIIGKEGVVLRVGRLDADHVAILFGGGPARIEQVAQLARKKAAPLAEDAGIKAIAAHLPGKGKVGEAYIAVDTILRLINDAAVAVGEEKPMPVEIPNIEAPASLVVSSGKLHQQFNLYVPMKAIKMVKDVVTGAAAAKVKIETDKPADEEETTEGSRKEAPVSEAVK